MDARKMACVAAAGFVGMLLVGAAAFPAHAQSISNRPVTVTQHRDAGTRQVPYGDLALNTKQGRSTLMHRVGEAVYQVCPGFDGNFGAYDVDSCRDFAWAGARPQIDSAFRAALSGGSLAMSIEITAGK